jgi:hypothetical protein
MKRAKRVTKRQLKAKKKFLAELAKNQPLEVLEARPKTQRKSVFLPLSVYLTKQAEKKHAKKHERDERRTARADKLAVKKAERQAKKLAREAKEAKREARKARIMALVDQLGK